MTRKPGSRRGGFTLLELLVVIAIIAILAGMLLVSVQRVWEAGRRTQIRNDISNMSSAIGTFEAERKVDHLPSRLRLKEDGRYNLSDPVEQDTRVFLKKLFPQCALFNMDWNGDGQVSGGAQGTFDLEGWQCIVFCLGGIPQNQGGSILLQGFSSNPFNPTEPRSVRQDRIGPYYNFEAKRLNITYAPGLLSNRFFPGYDDPYGTPYAYFSSYKRDNGYNRYGDPNLNASAVSDCAALGLFPYFEPRARPLSNPPPPTKYHNPNTFQIISAGRDKLFGVGGEWPTPSVQGAPPPSTPPPAPTPFKSLVGEGDNLSNFTNTILNAK